MNKKETVIAGAFTVFSFLFVLSNTPRGLRLFPFKKACFLFLN